MANNRYFFKCPCGEEKYIGKSLGRGMYGPGSFMHSPEENNSEAAGFLLDLYDWLWGHLIECNHPEADVDPVLGPEWARGEVFKVITEYPKEVAVD